MATARIIVVLFVAGLLLAQSKAKPTPDSAGLVEMVPGLSYGGIPYGSVSGALANYNQPQRLQLYPYNSLQASASVFLPDTRTAPQTLPLVY